MNPVRSYLLAITIVFSATIRAQTYVVNDLGLGMANDINNSGQVVGTGGGMGFFYDGSTRISLTNVVVGTITNPATGESVAQRGDVPAAWAINDSGQIGASFFGLNTSGGIQANGLAWPQVYWVTGIDTEGSAIGWHDSPPTPTGGLGWSRLVSGNQFSQYYDINRSNVIAGVAGAASPAFRDFREQRGRACVVSNGVVTYIDPRPLPEDYIDGNLNTSFANHLSDAYGINDSGVVVGSMALSVGGARRAFRYTDSGLEDLGTLGGTNSTAREINAAGVIVGESLTSDDKTHAFIYRDGVMTDLNSFLPSGSGMELISASAINDNGQIVGQAIVGGEMHAYLLSPPELVSAPGISTPPVGGRLALGDSLTLSVTAVGAVPFTYQWTLNGTNIDNATNSTYTISSATAADAGDYRVLVSNSGGTTPSIAVHVDVLDPELTAISLVALDIAGSVGATYRVEFRHSANVSAWTTLTNITLTTSHQIWVDLDSRAYPSRIYRAVRLP